MDVGGQAVMEGVMMRGENRVAISVRKKDGIKTKLWLAPNWGKGLKKILFVRGVLALADTLYIGMKALIYSAEETNEGKEEISRFELGLSIFLAFAFAIGLFVLLPLLISHIFSRPEDILFNIVDGIVRVLLFTGYLFFVSKIKDIRRIFEYHGAEHKVVNCYEAGKKLTLENAKKFSTVHLRCGTNFVFIVLILSIIVFSFIRTPIFWHKFLFRILLIPVIAGISYEILKLNAKGKSKILALIIKPGVWIQKITTREPDDKQIRVALAALKGVI